MIYSPFSLLLEFSAVKLNSCTQLNNIILLILSFTDAGSVKPSYCDSSLEDKKGAKKRRLLVGKSPGNHNDEHRNIKMGVPFKALSRCFMCDYPCCLNFVQENYWVFR